MLNLFQHRDSLIRGFRIKFIDLVALSAILYGVGEYGFTPNRTAVLGSNLLIFFNLILIMRDLYPLQAICQLHDSS